MKADNKRLKNDYQQTPRPMGIFLIRNNRSDKIFLVAGLNLNGAINRHKFQLSRDSHANKQLQADWNQLGSDNFAFEIVDELTPRPDLKLDYRAELASLEKLWLEKLQPFGDVGYNERKLSRAELLRRMAQNSKRSD
ncbi:MAG TPA: GIY-YIG nuclease family protein [Pyrinomonadaceae bacterium]|jgi:hypothetical protein|nr:GIY-YIG nuclease family protein [Pyrinomonadaceae bacterium]